MQAFSLQVAKILPWSTKKQIKTERDLPKLLWMGDGEVFFTVHISKNTVFQQAGVGKAPQVWLWDVNQQSKCRIAKIAPFLGGLEDATRIFSCKEKAELEEQKA